MVSYYDWLVEFLQQLPQFRKALETATNQQERYFIERSIKDRERLLAQLPELDRMIVEQMVINKVKAATIAAETGLKIREVQNRKDAALEQLLYCRHGASYQP